MERGGRLVVGWGVGVGVGLETSVNQTVFVIFNPLTLGRTDNLFVAPGKT